MLQVSLIPEVKADGLKVSVNHQTTDRMREVRMAGRDHYLDLRTYLILREVHCIHDVQQTIIGRGS